MIGNLFYRLVNFDVRGSLVYEAVEGSLRSPFVHRKAAMYVPTGNARGSRIAFDKLDLPTL